MGHWETRMWETCDITVWDTTRDLDFPVTRDKDLVKSVRDTEEDRYANFVISPEILHFCRQVLEEGEPGNSQVANKTNKRWSLEGRLL